MRKFKMSRPVMITWAILLILIITVLNGFKPWLRYPSEKDFFFWDVAVDFSSPDICGKIHRWAYLGAGFAEIPIKYTRSNCYYDVAMKTGNPDLCRKVRPLSTFFSDGSRYRKICEGLRRGYGDPNYGSSHVGSYKLSDMLSQLGFPESRIRKDPQYARYPSTSDENISKMFFISFYHGLEFGRVPGGEEFLDAVRKF